MSDPLPHRDPRNNRILEALPTEDRDRLVRSMVTVSLPIKTVLFEPGEPIGAVHFPLDGVISLVTPLDDGAIVEVATVGNEGIVGVPLVPGGSLAVRAISQVSGSALRMEASGQALRALERSSKRASKESRPA